jgi:tRNA(fMet)-specific endonuclease VapC
VSTDAYLLDTSIASIVFDADHPRHDVIRTRVLGLGAGSTIWICSISFGEIEYGLQVSPAIPVERHAAIRATLGRYHVYDVDQHTARYYGELRGALFRRFATRDAKGRLKQKQPEALLDPTTSKELGVQENDIWILAVAIQYNLTFVTLDRMTRLVEAAVEVHSYDRVSLWTVG